MRVTLDDTGDNCVIAVDGELDRDTLMINLWDSLSGELLSKVVQSKHVTIDLAEVGRGDTAGLAWLLNAIRDIRAQHKSVAVQNIPKKLVDLASLSNANELITQQRG